MVSLRKVSLIMVQKIPVFSFLCQIGYSYKQYAEWEMIPLCGNKITIIAILGGYFTTPEPLLAWHEWPGIATERTVQLVGVDNNNLTAGMWHHGCSSLPIPGSPSLVCPDCAELHSYPQWCSELHPCLVGRAGGHRPNTDLGKHIITKALVSLKDQKMVRMSVVLSVNMFVYRRSRHRLSTQRLWICCERETLHITCSHVISLPLGADSPTPHVCAEP